MDLLKVDYDKCIKCGICVEACPSCILSMGELGPECKKLQKRTEKYSQVHVLGTVNNVPQLMQASDLFLTKPGGLSPSEAMAAELPMVLILSLIHI